MEKTKLIAPDISCDHCLGTIQKAVTALPGVQWVSGDAASKTVELTYDPQLTSLEAIEQAMADEDYPVAK